MQIGVLSLISIGTAQNVHEYIESFISTTREEVPISFKSLQHIRAKSYKIRADLVDFGGTAQKEQLVYLARGTMSMSKLIANPAHTTIVGI